MVHSSTKKCTSKPRLELALPAGIAGLFAGYSALILTVLQNRHNHQNFLLRYLIPTREIVAAVQAYPHIALCVFLVLTMVTAWTILRWAKTQHRFRNFTGNLSEFHVLILALICGSVIGVGCLLGLQEIVALQPIFQCFAGAVLITAWMIISVCTFPWAMGFTMLFSLWVVIAQTHNIFRGI